jgi:hypothetical protein
VDECSGSRRREQGSVTSKAPWTWAYPERRGLMQDWLKVDADEGLWEKAVPQIEWEVEADAVEACNEVGFEGSDGPFGGVTAIEVRRGESEIDVFGVHELLRGM